MTVGQAGAALERAGLVEAFGHASARDGAITTTAPLRLAQEIALDGPDDPRRPLEAPLHRAVYAARPDVGALCRTHSPAVVAWGARVAVPPLLHGLGLLAGEVALHDEPCLVVDDDLAQAAARALGDADCLLVCANGALTTGRDLEQALVRAWYLEQRARVALDAGAAASSMTDAQRAARAVHVPAEERRARRWLADRFAAGSPPPTPPEGPT